ncbi:MAG: glycosyltransferase [Proteobacteria bacterium]|nr:glycosyltransferase [Pseudomonadota bacterium]
MTGGAVETAATAVAALSLLAWLYLILFHGRFWRADQRLGHDAAPETWPAVAAVVPARDEADVVGAAVQSLLTQDYPGRFQVFLVDDESADGTAEAARAAAPAGRENVLTVLATEVRPPGWVGKMWAVATGVAAATANQAERPVYLLLTDADIAHPEDGLRRLVAKAEAGRLDLASLMVRLHCRDGWERLLVPAFVYFFQKLFPFPRVNDPRSGIAAAAGGCMLVRASALETVGGIAAIRGAIIDDCALAAALKPKGPIWLGLAEDHRSLRPYEGLGGLWQMVARSAFAQLRHSWLLLIGTVLGMVLLYLAPPVLGLWSLVEGWGFAATAGLAAWAIMAATLVPTLRLYGRPLWEGFLLPVSGLLYTAMTVDSAIAHASGRGGAWKGRIQAGRDTPVQ